MPMRQGDSGRSAQADAAPADSARPVRRIPLDSLLGGTREVIIQHASEEYRLRLTSKGKLILTK